MAESYGLVVEGQFDTGPFTHFVRKIAGAETDVIPLQARGAPNLMTKFPGLLRVLERIKAGQPVDRAIVIRDAQNKDVKSLYAEMRSKIATLSFAFPKGVHFYVVRQELEALILADDTALNGVIQSRGGRHIVTPNQQLESLEDPKAVLERLVRQSGLVYTSEFCSEVAARADLKAVQYRCPSFDEFVRAVSTS